MKLTPKQERFAFNVAIKGMTYHDAYLDAYDAENMKPAVVDVNASRLVASDKIALRIRERRDEIEGPDILSRREYLAGLTDIFRTNITDFQTCGADGSYIDIGPENPHVSAVSEITSRTEYDDKGANAAVITKVKLHDKLRAGQDVAKVKGWLKENGNTYNDIKILVVREPPKQID